MMEAKAQPAPKFDLEASSFPPLPGSVVSMRGDAMPEVRLSDVVRGLKVTNKVKRLSSLIPFTLMSCIPSVYITIV